MIGIINYDSGNLRSVSRAFEKVGADVRLVEDAQGMEHLDAVVLPGVGSFGDSVRALQQRGLWEPLKDWISGGNPFFGICLGYQLLFESSEESPGVPGFGIFPGKVVHFEKHAGRKIPQMGWNTISRVNVDSPNGTDFPMTLIFSLCIRISRCLRTTRSSRRSVITMEKILRPALRVASWWRLNFTLKKARKTGCD